LRRIIAAVIVSRTFAVLAAAMAVTSVALIVLTPNNMTLIQGLAQLSPELPQHIRHAIQNAFGVRIWAHLATPLLVRPVWLVPVSLCLLCAGISASTGWPTESPRSTRTRS
jgi:hypothetical protein